MPRLRPARTEVLLTMRDDRQDDEHAVTVTKFRCLSCGCQFQTVERWETRAEVLRHGREAEP
jgi:transcriptional regulator NrdR family protein